MLASPNSVVIVVGSAVPDTSLFVEVEELLSTTPGGRTWPQVGQLCCSWNTRPQPPQNFPAPTR